MVSIDIASKKRHPYLIDCRASPRSICIQVHFYSLESFWVDIDKSLWLSARESEFLCGLTNPNLA